MSKKMSKKRYDNFKLAKLYCYKKNGKPDTSGRWYAYYHFIDPDTGKMKMIKEYGGINYFKDTKQRLEEGNLLVATINEMLLNGFTPFDKEQPQADKMSFQTLPEVLEELLLIKKSTWRPVTQYTYKYIVKMLVDYLSARNLQFLAAKDFTPRMAITFSDHLLTSRNLKATTFNTNMNSYKTLFNMMVHRNVIDKNPFQPIKKLPQEVGKNLAFSADQKIELKDAINDMYPRLWLFVKFIYHCYIRPKELCGLRVGNINVKERVIIIPASIAKNKKQQSVAIPDTFIEDIRAMGLENLSADKVLFGKGLEFSDVEIQRKYVTARHTKVLRKLEYKKEYTMYSWKHTGVVDAFKAGVDLYDLMRQLRHHSLDQTLVYMKSLGLQPNIGFSSKAPAL